MPLTVEQKRELLTLLGRKHGASAAPAAPSASDFDLGPREMMPPEAAPTATTAVDPDAWKPREPDRFANPLALLPKGTTENALKTLAATGVPGAYPDSAPIIPAKLFEPPVTGGSGPVDAIPGQASIGATPDKNWLEKASFGLLGPNDPINLLKNVVQFPVEQGLGALEDPVAAGRGLVEFPVHVGTNVAQAGGFGYGQPPEVQYEAEQALRARPLDVALLAVPLALRGLTATARGLAHSMDANKVATMARQVAVLRENGVPELRIRNAVNNEPLYRHIVRSLEREVPQPTPGTPGSRARVKANVERSRRAREKSRFDPDREPLTDLNRTLEEGRARREAAKEANRDYIEPGPDPLAEIQQLAEKRDPAILEEVIDLGYDVEAVARMMPDELAYRASGGRIGRLPDESGLSSTPKPGEFRTETGRPATQAARSGSEAVAPARRSEAPVESQRAKEPWYRGEDQVNATTGDRFYSASKNVAGDFGRVKEITATERPRNPLVVESKDALAQRIGYKGDPMAEPKGVSPRFDQLAKDYAQKRGHDGIIYENGTFGARELHAFGRPDRAKQGARNAAKEPSKVEPSKAESTVAPDVPDVDKVPVQKTGAKAVSEEPVIGLSKAKIDKLRDELKMNELEAPERQTWESNLQEAKAGGFDRSAAETANRVLNDGKPATAVEHAGMVLRAAELKNQYKAHIERAAELTQKGERTKATKAREEAAAVMDQIDYLTRAAQRSGTEAGRALNIRKMMLNTETYDLASVVQEATVAKGKPLTPKEHARFEELVRDYERLQAEMTDLRSQNAELIAKEEARRADILIRREAARAKKRGLSEDRRRFIHADIDRMGGRLNELGYRFNDITGVTAEAAYLISRIAFRYAQLGANRVADVVARIKERMPALSERDIRQSILTKDPQRQKRARSDAQKRFDAVRREAALMEKIERLQQGIVDLPAKKSVPPQHILELQKQLRDLRKEAYKGVQEARLLENTMQTINELQDMLDNQYRKVKKRESVPSAERQAAKEQVKKLRKYLRIEDTLADLKQQLRTGDFKVNTRPEPTPEPPAIQRKQVEIEMARKKIRQEIRDREPVGVVTESINTLRTLKATADMSATARQGLLLAIMRPGAVPKAFAQSVQATFSKYKAAEIDNAIRSHPDHYIREQSKLELTESGGKLTRGEEQFMSRIVDRIPGAKQTLGEIIGASERHMTTYLNLMRVEMFDWFRKKYPNATQAELKAWADFVNVSSGRGKSFGGKENYAGLLIFAPRFAISRLQYPLALKKHWAEPRVRKHIAESYVRLATLGVMTMGIAELAGAEVGMDPRESDFMKIRIGDTRFDMWAGLQQPIRAVLRIAQVGTDRAGITGKHLPEGDKDINPIDIITRFVSYKVSPAISLGSELLSGENVVGEERTPLETVARIPQPIIVESIREAWEREGPVMAAAVGAAEFVGVAAGSYPDSQSRVRRDIRWLKYQGKTKEALRKLEEWNRKNPDNRMSPQWLAKLPTKQTGGQR